ncbi:hypothetical protein [Bacteroides sp.]
MRERQQTFRHTIRFRYWIRKGYAAFASIGICVTIGQLRKNVTERALRKQLSPDASVCMRRTTEETEEHETETPPVVTLLQELLILLQPLTKTTVCQSGKTGQNYINKKLYTSPIHLGGVEPHPYTGEAPEPGFNAEYLANVGAEFCSAQSVINNPQLL